MNKTTKKRLVDILSACDEITSPPPPIDRVDGAHHDQRSQLDRNTSTRQNQVKVATSEGEQQQDDDRNREVKVDRGQRNHRLIELTQPAFNSFDLNPTLPSPNRALAWD